MGVVIVDLVIGGAAVAVSVYGLQRHARGMAAYWRGKQRADGFERELRLAREELSSPPSFRAATGHDFDLVSLLRGARKDEDELATCGFRVLGDIVVGSTTAIMRSLVDQAGTTCAVLFVAARHPNTVLLRFSSYLVDEVFSTARALVPSLAEPPFVHRQTLAHQPLAALLSHHRAFARLDDETRSFQRIESLDALLAQLARGRQDIVRWRNAQPPEELLDADLRSVFGEHYAAEGASWARRLRGRLPKASVRR